MFVKVVINSKTESLNRTFDYKVPAYLEDKLHLGSRVFVDFRNRKEDAFVIEFFENSEYECKEIVRIY